MSERLRLAIRESIRTMDDPDGLDAPMDRMIRPANSALAVLAANQLAEPLQVAHESRASLQRVTCGIIQRPARTATTSGLDGIGVGGEAAELRPDAFLGNCVGDVAAAECVETSRKEIAW